VFFDNIFMPSPNLAMDSMAQIKQGIINNNRILFPLLTKERVRARWISKN